MGGLGRRAEDGRRDSWCTYFHAPFQWGRHRLAKYLSQMPSGPAPVRWPFHNFLSQGPGNVSFLSSLNTESYNLLQLVQAPWLLHNLSRSFKFCLSYPVDLLPLFLTWPWLIHMPRTIHQSFLRLSLHRQQRASAQRKPLLAVASLIVELGL